MNRSSGTLLERLLRSRGWLPGLALLVCLLVRTADACQVCIPMPVKTLADRLLEADALVLAREDPERPFHYVTVEVLKGEPGNTPIDAFLPSMDRRILARYPQRHMLLARVRPDGNWSALGITDAEYERFVRRILGHAGTWKPMERNNPQRLAEFAPLLGHADIRLHEAAYLEIARAPYNEIRRIATEVPIETVRGMLDEPRYLEWRSLAILMLAESQRSADRAQIRKAFEDKQRLGSLFNLAAWATAYLAIEGEDGLERIRRWYLTQPERSREELKEIVKALSVYASAVAPFREPVAAAYRTLLEVHPSVAPDVTHDLIAWRRWDFAPRIREIRTDIAGKDPLAAYALGLYLRMAAGDSASGTALPRIDDPRRSTTSAER
ncbi:MAG: hypothetical protein PVJ65_08215 [Chromatiales bacterium]